MKKCEKCGMEFGEDYSFCPSCGGTLFDIEEKGVEEECDNLCPECGTEIPDGYLFCPECGTKVGEDEELGDSSSTRSIEESVAEEKETVLAPPPVSEPPKKKMTKKTKLIIAGAIAAALIIVLCLVNYMSPRDMVINSGNDIEVFVGDEFEIPVSAEGLSEAELQGIVWTSDDDKLIKVENGVLTAAYDKNSFNATIDDTEGNDEEECTYTSYIYGHMEKGLKKWDGSAKVVVSLKPVDIESGKLIKEPADPRNSYIVITAADNYSTYFYLESKTKPANDMSFVIKKGEKETVYVPSDTYTFYEAGGDVWYGSKILFGPQTFYQKDPEDYKFTSSTYWTLELGVVDGNIQADNINSEDFPE